MADAAETLPEEKTVTQKPEHAKVLKRAMQRLQQWEDAMKDNVREALEDVKFALLGEQWDADMLTDRQGRPCLTVNKLAQYINQVVNEQRQAKQGIKVVGVDSKSDKAVAKIETGLIRNIEYLSRADLAYETAYEHAVSGGLGYFGVITCYAGEDTFDQDIRIRTFDNFLAVKCDHNATMADGSDMGWAFVEDKLPKDEFEEEYGEYKSDAVPDSYQEAWHDDDCVYIREYWERTRAPIKLSLWSDGVTRKEGEEVPPGLELVRERDAYEYKVKMYKLAGDRVISEADFPASSIPIFPVYGKRLNVEGRIHIMGLVRFARDPQRMFNYWRSSMAEKIALTPLAPYLVESDMVEGYETVWQYANTKPFPYLPYKRSASGAAPQRASAGADVTGIVEANMQAEVDIKASVGIYDPQLGINQGGQSGRAILALQKQGDTSTFNFQDNLARAKAQCGRVIVELIGKLYDTTRIVRVLGEDGESDLITINKKVPGPGGVMQVMHDVTLGKYDVEVTTGPSFATKRMETSQAMLDFMQAFPAAAPVLGKRLAKLQDWDGAEEIAQELAALSPGPQNPQAMVQQVAEQAKSAMAAQRQQYEDQIKRLEDDKAIEWARLKLDAQKAKTDHEKVEIERMKATGELAQSLGPQLQVLAEQAVGMALQNAKKEELEEASGEDDAVLDSIVDAAFPEEMPLPGAEQISPGMLPPQDQLPPPAV